MSTKTLINGEIVGEKKLSEKAIKKYCEKRNITIKSISYQYYDINYGFEYEHLNLETFQIKSESNSDPLKEMLGI